MRIFSPAFSDGELIPGKYTCDSENVSPPLEWDDVPEAAKSLSLIVDDPDAPSGVFVHWLLYGIRPTEKGLTEGVGLEGPTSAGANQGRNGFGKVAYGGPCPAGGTHRYYFRLNALDTDLTLRSGVEQRELDSALRGHVIAEAELMGRYKRASR